MRSKQSQATKYIKDLLASRGVEVNPGIVLIGEEPWQVFEHNSRCIGIDFSGGAWVGVRGEKWDCIASPCSVSGALQAIEFLTENSPP